MRKNKIVALHDLSLNKKDGVDHINVAYNAATQLGTMLFMSTVTLITPNNPDYYIDVETPDGPFRSIENYWLWLNTVSGDREDLKALKQKMCFMTSREAKNTKALIESELRKTGDYKFVKVKDMSHRIATAYGNLVNKNNALLTALMYKKDIPWDVYYTGDPDSPPVRPNYAIWLVSVFNELERAAKEYLDTGIFSPQFDYLLPRK